MAKLILMRHGASAWNVENRFTGWVDVPLSKQGVDEAIKGGKKIKDIPIDIIYTSTLIRAIMTALLAMNEHDSKKIPVMIHKDEKGAEWSKIGDPAALETVIPTFTAWQLNERMYGELQGMNKDSARERFGKEQVHIWRRSYDVPPPGGESLKMTAERTLPFFEEEIMARLSEGKNVFVSAHGNSLRAILMKIHAISEKDIVSLEIETGLPMVYEVIEGQLKKIELSE